MFANNFLLLVAQSTLVRTVQLRCVRHVRVLMVKSSCNPSTIPTRYHGSLASLASLDGSSHLTPSVAVVGPCANGGHGATIASDAKCLFAQLTVEGL